MLLYTRNCGHCRKQFTSYNGTRKYCSKACYLADVRVERVCEICRKVFTIPRTYASRPHKAGRFCSTQCKRRAYVGRGNPNAKWMKEHPEDIDRALYKQTAQQRYDTRVRREALSKIAKAHNLEEIRCMNCNCNIYSLLAVNHINGGGSRTKESGRVLWRKVRQLSIEDVKASFDILCEPCNWLHSVKQRYGETGHKIAWEVVRT